MAGEGRFVAQFTELTALVRAALDMHARLPLFGVERDGEFVWTTYADMAKLTSRYERVLASKGVGPRDLVGILSANRPEWLAAAIAAHGRGATVVPMYEVQTEKDWRYILRDARAKVCLTSTGAFAEKIEALRKDLPALAYVASFDAVEKDPAATEREVTTVGPEPDDLAFVIYTSGTTGDPKGVELTHRGFASMACALHEAIPFAPGNRSVSILPWAHVGGIAELFVSVKAGVAIAIAEAVDRIVPTIQATRPTHVAGVPRVWNKLYDAIHKAMAGRPAPIRRLFERGLAISSAKRAGKALGFVDRMVLALAERLVFPKIRERLGGELRFALSGAAALSVDVARFIDAIGVEVIELYGLTEVSAIATTNSPGKSRVGTVGQALPGVTIRIDDAGSDDGSGEVLIKTPYVMKGYRGLDDETRTVKGEDGWLRSGDLGRLSEDGFLVITGRVREVYKLENGKFVSPAPIEEKLTTSPFIAQAMVHGLNKPFNVALLVADMATVKAFCTEHGLGELAPDAAVAHERVLSRLQDEVRTLGASGKAYERVEKFHVVTEEFTVANDMLTPTLKVKRRKVLDRWGSALERLYE